MIDWQLWGTLLFLGVAVAFLSWRTVRGLRRLKSGRCSSSCGCSQPLQKTIQPGLVPEAKLTARLQQRTLPK